MKLDHTTFQRWIKWIERIKKDLTQIIDFHQIYDYFREVMDKNSEHINGNEGVIFCDFTIKCYGVQASMGIRRQIELNDDSISLIRLLDQLKKCLFKRIRG